MKPKQAYVVLAASGSSWETHGPLAVAYGTLKEAEAAAHDFSIRYPQRTLGVYELRFVYVTQQKVVKQKTEAPAKQPVKRNAEVPTPDAANVVRIRVAS